MTAKKKIVIVGGCYNEVGNLEELYAGYCRTAAEFPDYDFEFLWIDNDSTDGTRELIRRLAAGDKRLKAIFNSRNYGHIRSPFYAISHARGDAVIAMCTDLQDPPELLPELIRAWESGHKVVVATRRRTECSKTLEVVRRFYYYILQRASGGEMMYSGFTGYGIYDRVFMDALRKFKEPYPYFRGLVAEIGFKPLEIKFDQPERKHGQTKNDFFTLYDMAMTGFVNHTKLPLRLAVFCGIFIGLASLVIALVYLVLKLCFWNTFSFGMAPLMIGLFFFSAVQLIFIGIIGEYLGAVWTQVKERPLVIEEERINFTGDEGW